MLPSNQSHFLSVSHGKVSTSLKQHLRRKWQLDLEELVILDT